MTRKITLLAAFAATIFSIVGFSSCKQKFPAVRQNGKTAIVAHRGAWKYEEAGFSQNSIASLAYAQKLGLWGSEFDLHLTADGQILVFHDDKIKKVRIDTVDASHWDSYRLPNGEKIPTLDEYLTQGEKSDKTILVCELKKHYYPEKEIELVDKTVAALKAHGLFTPSRVIFISFSKRMCDKIAREYPKFVVQYLNGEIPPEQLAQNGINGFDYERKEVYAAPQWIKEAHKLGMSTNSWTINKAEHIRQLIDWGIDAITTNEPLLTREILGEKEFKLD